MWDFRKCETEPGEIKRALCRRGIAPTGDIDALVDAFRERRRLLGEIDQVNAARNLLTKEGSGDSRNQAREARETAAALKQKLTDVETHINSVLTVLPNKPHHTVPDGVGEDNNVIVREWGEPRKFDFPPRDHVDLGHELGVLDLPRGARIAGSGFPCLRGLGARLNRAVINCMLDVHRERRGYLEVALPFLANRACFYGTGQLPKFEGDLYWTEGGQLGLVPTAEVPLTNLYAGEILPEDTLPIRLTAYTPCWRREAGAHGRDTRGIIRVHQFEKVELVKVTTPETSYDELEELTDDAEEILRRLQLPHRRVLLCAGDLGFGAAKTYDVEVWLPAQRRYREISSCSNCEDFQARRMKLRFRRNNGKTEYAHTLNGSGLAVGRTLVAIIENYQQADGTVTIPEALVPYMNGIERIKGERIRRGRENPVIPYEGAKR